MSSFASAASAPAGEVEEKAEKKGLIKVFNYIDVKKKPEKKEKKEEEKKEEKKEEEAVGGFGDIFGGEEA